MTEKTPNYTDEQTAEMVERYEGAEDDLTRAAVVEQLAQDLGKTVRSIRAKLVREGVYKKKTYTTKTGGKAETKDQIVEDIAEILQVSSERLGGLEKATKGALGLIRGQFVAAKATIFAFEQGGETGEVKPDSS